MNITVSQTPTPPPPAPVLELTASSLNPLAGETVHFTGSWNQQVPVARYRFDWGDGETSTVSQPFADHTYARAGSYTVRLTASLAAQVFVAAIQPQVASNPLRVTVNRPVPPPSPIPKLGLRANSQNSAPNQAVQFTVSWDQKVAGAQYRFLWGDGQSSDSASPQASHAYASPGNYSVQVLGRGLANDHAFSASSNSVLITVAQPPPPNPQPNLSLRAGALNPPANQPVQFTASWDQKVAGARYRFFWGDGQSSDSASPQVSHAYSSPGHYSVQVLGRGLANDHAFSARSNSVSITVAQPPPPSPQPNLSLRAGALNPPANQPVQFTASWDQSVAGTQYRFLWGDDQSSDSASPQAFHAYASPGNYTVQVSARGLANDQAFVAQSNPVSLTVTPSSPPSALIAILSADRQNAAIGEPVQFTASLNQDVGSAQYHFVFGDGNSQDSPSNVVEYRYPSPGNFQPAVTVSAPDGQQVTSPAIVLDIQPPTGLAHEFQLNVQIQSKDFVVGKDIVLHGWMDPPQPHATYYCNWGDNSPPDRVGAEGVCTHRYARAGHYSVGFLATVEGSSAAPLRKDLIVVISTAFWPFSLRQWLLILAALGGAAVIWRILHRYVSPRPEPELHLTGFADPGIHIVKNVDTSIPHLSLRLRPGAEPAEHQLTFSKRAAPSD